MELDGTAPVYEIEFREGKVASFVGRVGGEGERGREAGVVEGGAARGGGRVDHDELVPRWGAAAEPETVAVEELGRDLIPRDKLGRVPGQELLGAGVVALGDLLGVSGGGKRQGGPGEQGQGGRGEGEGAKCRRHVDLGSNAG